MNDIKIQLLLEILKLQQGKYKFENTVGDQLANTFMKDFYIHLKNTLQNKTKKKQCCVSDILSCI